MGHHGLQRGGHHEGRGAHVEQPKGVDSVSFVQRGQQQVPGDGGAQADLGGLGVTHFAHQDDIRVLPQRGAQHAREAELDLLVDLHLGEAGQAVFDRVFDRDDLGLLRVQLRERRVERGGLARAGGGR